MCTVVDIIDGNKVMVDGPLEITGVSRQMMPLKRLALTDLAVSIPKSSKDQVIKDAFEVSDAFTAAVPVRLCLTPLPLQAADIMAKWEATSWAKKLTAKKRRANLTDFDRFKLMVARQQKAKIVKAKMAEIKG